MGRWDHRPIHVCGPYLKWHLDQFSRFYGALQDLCVIAAADFARVQLCRWTIAKNMIAWSKQEVIFPAEIEK